LVDNFSFNKTSIEKRLLGEVAQLLVIPVDIELNELDSFIQKNIDLRVFNESMKKFPKAKLTPHFILPVLQQIKERNRLKGYSCLCCVEFPCPEIFPNLDVNCSGSGRKDRHESMEDCAIRETKEESRVNISKQILNYDYQLKQRNLIGLNEKDIPYIIKYANANEEQFIDFYIVIIFEEVETNQVFNLSIPKINANSTNPKDNVDLLSNTLSNIKIN
jgi:hypothetical protein